MTSTNDRFEAHRRQLAACEQSHVLDFWPELNEPQRADLLDDLDQVDLERCRPLIETHVRGRPRFALPTRIEPAPVLPVAPDAANAELYRRAEQLGADAIRAGKVAAFTVAGGQGTRLGYDGPKGGFPITPVRSHCLFHLFAQYLIGVERRYGTRPPWYVMTSPSNHEATLRIFEAHEFFGLDHADVMFFQQGQMPAFLPDGRIALASKHRLALSPDGHGGSLQALRAGGALVDMSRRGIDYISYFQIDNPLVKAVDPLFIGLHITLNSEMSSKAVSKADDLERVGNFCLADGKLSVIEYSDLPEEYALKRNPDGSRRFDAGSIAIHCLSRSFVERLTDDGSDVHLPWHRAEKRVTTVGSDGIPVEPDALNAVKLEMFIFDAIPLASNPIVLYTPREEEFSPVKNAEGVDSPATARRDLIRRAARWLESCGCTVPRGADGEPAVELEIAPDYAVDAVHLRERLTSPPDLTAESTYVLE